MTHVTKKTQRMSLQSKYLMCLNLNIPDDKLFDPLPAHLRPRFDNLMQESLCSKC